MRKITVLASAVIAVGFLVPTVVAARETGKKPPVDLEGKVNAKGTGTVKRGSIDVEADDFYFKPTFIKAKAGSKIKVKLENEGNATHTFTVDSLGIDKTVSSGKKATVSLTVPDSGAVAFYCSFHESQGMQGALFTKAGAAAASTGGGGGTGDTRSPSTTGGGSYGY